MNLVTEHLVGRAEELKRIERALDSLAERSPAALALLGEAGIGKSRLLSELGVSAGRRGYLVLAGRATELERDLPFGTFVDALDDYLAALEPRRVQRLGPELGAELARIFPSLSALADDSLSGLQDERYRAHRAVRELLERLAAVTPLVLVLDDLHWADPASVELVAALTRRPPNAAVLLALGLRPRQAHRKLSTAIREASRDGYLDAIELGLLSEEEASGMLGQLVAARLHEVFYRESGGNPFYLEQLARGTLLGPRASDGAAPTNGAGAIAAAVEAVGVPRAVAATLAAELDELSEAARELLNGAAVAGDPFELDYAAAAARLAEGELLTALDELLDFDLVSQADAPRRFRFRHPLVHRAVYTAAPAGWSLGAHERVAQAMELHGASPTALAHHVEQSARPGDERAIALLRRAGEAAAPRAPASAARWFAAALRLLPEREPAAGPVPELDGEQRTELLVMLARSLAAAGRLEESRGALIEAIERLPSEEAALHAALTAECATVEHLLGRHSEARARLVETLEHVPERGSPQAVSLMIELAMDHYFAMDYEAMREVGEQALAGARLLDDAPLAAAAEAVLASAAAMGCHVEAARGRASSAAAAVDALPDSELARRLDAAAQLGWAEFYLERYDASIGHLERGIAVSRATGRDQRLSVMTEALAASLAMRGRLHDAAELQDRGIDAARLSTNRQRLCWALFNRSWTARLAGDLELALRLAHESVELTPRLDEGIISALARAVMGVVLLETDELDRGIDELVKAAGGVELPLIPGPRKCVYFEPLTQAELKRGRLVEAASMAQLAARAAEGHDLRVPSALAGRARAAVALADGEANAAASEALASAEAAAEVGARIEAARSRTLAGRALVVADKRDDAKAELTTAIEELEACGALRYRDEALHELRRAGGRPKRMARGPRASGVGVDSLTAREREVAELIRDRKTNREIAAELFLSEKTVETHVRHLFEKLSVSSRVEVARALDA